MMRLHRIARESEDGNPVRRLLAPAVYYYGGSRTQAAKMSGVTLQVAAIGCCGSTRKGPEGPMDRKAPGPPSRIKDEHRAALAEMIENGPQPAVHGVVR